MTGYVAGMVTRIYKHRRRRLFLREHREAKGVSASVMGGRLGIERESVYRLEREPQRVDSEKQAAWAEALGVEPEDLWRLPDVPRPPPPVSLDALVKDAPSEVIEMAADIVRRLVARG